ncbi:hypothetical protein JL722_13107 [Aureococcus anophagefferens]|nr:hypothetical protein JL722_13107 [Aureococcus anophagefferens]
MTLLLRCAASAACAIAADWSAARHRVGTVGGPPLDAAAGNDLIRARLADRFAGRRGPFLVSRLALGAELGYAAHAAGRSLWADGDVLPALDLVVVRAPVSLADAPPHGSWSESLAATKAAIDAAGPVDVALLGCGSYGLPLAHHVLERGAVAIVGGGLRSSSASRVPLDGAPFFAAAANEHWVWPAADETPPGAAGVEGAAYWRPP